MFSINLDHLHWIILFVFYLLSSIGFDQFYTRLTRRNHHKGAGTALLQIIAGLFALLLIPLFSWKLPTDPRIWGLLLLASIFYALNDRLQMISRSHLELSEFIPISQLSKVFLFIFGVSFFHEPFYWRRLIGMLLVVIGNIVIQVKKNRIIFNRYSFLGGLAMLAFATAISLDIGVSSQFNMAFYATIAMFVPAFLIIFAERIKTNSFIQEWRLAGFWYCMTALFWIAAYIFSVLAYRVGGNVSAQVSLRGILPVLSFIFAYLFLKERHHLLKKSLAIGFIVSGIMIGGW